MVPRDASKRLRTTCTRFGPSRTLTSRRMGQIVARGYAIELVLSVSSSVIPKSSNRKENSLEKPERSCRVPGPHLPLKPNLTLGAAVALLLLSRGAGSMVASVARTWSNLGIMTLTSLGRLTIRMSSKTSPLLRPLSLRTLHRPQNPTSTSHSLRRKGITRKKKALRKVVLNQSLHLKMRGNQRRKVKRQPDQV